MYRTIKINRKLSRTLPTNYRIHVKYNNSILVSINTLFKYSKKSYFGVHLLILFSLSFFSGLTISKSCLVNKMITCNNNII